MYLTSKISEDMLHNIAMNGRHPSVRSTRSVSDSSHQMSVATSTRSRTYALAPSSAAQTTVTSSPAFVTRSRPASTFKAAKARSRPPLEVTPSITAGRASLTDLRCDPSLLLRTRRARQETQAHNSRHVIEHRQVLLQQGALCESRCLPAPWRR